MSKIVFKQSYKARASPSTPGLNVRHLNYIATRPGAVFNPGCGFGLWGQLPGNESIRILNDLEYAKQSVREASLDHTLYRAVISVGKDDAQRQGLYDRAKWEQIINDHIAAIAKEMDIKPQNLCWCASMHYAKNHPHVHLLYWDNGNDPRPDGMSRERFKEKAERIRADLSREIHREDIHEMQKEQREQIKLLRMTVQAMCREANPEQALNLSRLLQSGELEGLSAQFLELIRDIPAYGSLRYAYLPSAYKEKVDLLIQSCMELPELSKELEKYKLYTSQISELYSNSKTAAEEALDKAMQTLKKELGNQVMAAVRETKDELFVSSPSSHAELQTLIRTAVSDVIPNLESYQELKACVPSERIPVRCMEQQIPGFHEQLNNVVSDVLSDARVRLRLQSYALAAALEKGHIDHREAHHTVCGKKLSDEEWARYQSCYKEAKSDLRNEIKAQLREDVGWTHEAVNTCTAGLLCGMMRLVSQAAAQKQAGAAQAAQDRRMISKDKSREAKKDRQAIQSNAGGWDMDY